MRRCHFIAVLALLLLPVQSCGDSYTVFSSKYHVFFQCDAGISPYNAMSSLGVFISVRQSGANIVTLDMDGHETRMQMTEKEARSFNFGLCGLILGTPALDNQDCIIYAYDLGCPVCDRSSRHLTIDNTGVASCSSCHTSFDLNNNGFVISSDDDNPRPLYRYPVSRTGSSVVVSN